MPVKAIEADTTIVDADATSAVDFDLRAISDAFGQSSIKAKIYRRKPTGNLYVGEMPLSVLLDNPEEILKENFGGGAYELFIYVFNEEHNRHILRKRIRLDVEGLPKEVKPQVTELIDRSMPIDVNPIIEKINDNTKETIEANSKLAEERVEAAKELASLQIETVKQSTTNQIEMIASQTKMMIDSVSQSHNAQIAMMQQMFANQSEMNRQTFELALKAQQNNSGQKSPLIELAAIAAPIIETLITVNQGTGGLLSKITSALGPQVMQNLKDNGHTIVSSLIEETLKSVVGGGASGMLGKLAGAGVNQALTSPIPSPIPSPVSNVTKQTPSAAVSPSHQVTMPPSHQAVINRATSISHEETKKT
jgi:hypothetical protein